MKKMISVTIALAFIFVSMAKAESNCHSPTSCVVDQSYTNVNGRTFQVWTIFLISANGEKFKVSNCYLSDLSPLGNGLVDLTAENVCQTQISKLAICDQ